ncbi:MAG TPA: DUF1326 domain-containing protein [Gemmatimonadales bacterium]|nr:DUF1326 domain-containing protein [Gemmatimonadales bacterium]
MKRNTPVNTDLSWTVSGTYFEACNCEAVCPCRWEGERKQGRPSTYETCDFALSWRITEGRIGSLDLSGLSVMMAGTYSNHVTPPTPWRVILYVDDKGDQAQQRALADIFLGRVGGTTLRNFAAGIGEIYAVRPARIELDHTTNKKSMRAGTYVTARTARPAPAKGAVSCGVPGHDRPGQELVMDAFRVEDAPFGWEVRGRCGFATDFEYNSDS